jgi:hypothetical protein
VVIQIKQSLSVKVGYQWLYTRIRSRDFLNEFLIFLDCIYPNIHNSMNFILDSYALLIFMGCRMFSIINYTLHTIQLLFFIVIACLDIAIVHLYEAFIAIALLIVLRHPFVATLECIPRSTHFFVGLKKYLYYINKLLI